MNAVLANLVPALGWALLDFLWQGLLVGLIVLPLLALLRDARPQARYALLLLALLACIGLPLVSVLRGLGHEAATVSLTGKGFIAPQWLDDAGSAPGQAWQAQWQAYLPWIVAAWSLGASLLALRFVLGLHWIARARQVGRPPGFEWQARLERLSAAIGLSAPPALLIVKDLDSPAAAGWWRPVVLLPAALVANMPADLLEALLAHELAHVKRHDYFVNLLQGVVEVLLFYHPVVWWLSRQIRIEREQIADDLASRAIGQARPLALALQHLERMQAGIDHPFPDPQLAPAAHGGHLMNRIKRLLRPTPSGLRWKSGLPLIGITALCLAVYAQASTHTPPAVASAPAALAAVAPLAQPSPAVMSVPATAAVAAVAAVAAPAAMPTVAPVDAVAPVAPVAPIDAIDAPEPVEPAIELEGDAIHLRRVGDQDAYALVRKGHDSLLISGDSHDRSEVHQVRDQIDSDFLWFRRDGKSYVVSDPVVVAQAMKAWAPAEAMGDKMQALGDQMQPHAAQMEALSKKMQALAEQDEPLRRQMEATSRQMEPLAERQRELAERMRDLSLRMVKLDSEIDRQRLQADLDRLQTQMEPLNRQMSEIGARLEAQSRGMQSSHEPMQQLSKQMQLGSEPMKALSEKLEVLAKQQERLSHQADAQVKQLIEQSMREGKAQPKGRRQAR